jgi:hypothetical protein
MNVCFLCQGYFEPDETIVEFEGKFFCFDCWIKYDEGN